MPASLRKTLVESHVAAVTVAVLLFASLEGIYIAAGHLLSFLLLFIQIYQSHQVFDVFGVTEDRDPMMLSVTLSCLIGAAAALLCAWLVSRWTYGVGPLRCLGSYRDKITRKFHA
jgi:hypothetical protein